MRVSAPAQKRPTIVTTPTPAIRYFTLDSSHALREVRLDRMKQMQMLQERRAKGHRQHLMQALRTAMTQTQRPEKRDR